MPRFTVSHHDHPSDHLDLFLEIAGAADSEALATWRVPGGELDRLAWPGVSERIGAHRRDFLDHEGDVSGGRGRVRRLDHGEYEPVLESEGQLVVDLAGARLGGRLWLSSNPGGGWSSHWRPWGGAFVALEGIDGSGKSSAARAVAERLRAEGHVVSVTREPTDTGFGAVLRQRLAGQGDQVPLAMACGFAADRAEHLHAAEGMLHRRARGEIVLCDRYKLSSLVYQSQAGVPPTLIEDLNRGFPQPDLTVLFDLPVDLALARLAGAAGRGGDLYERHAFLSGVAERYTAEVERAAAGPHSRIARVHTLDARQSPEQVAAALHACVITISGLPALRWKN